ncbi:MAG: hypothetical protein JSW43_12265 [Gemmatimonadota bacterium]|nr:MAG: hypothetical protein JSW43_12265 [Gemmatimonadota bacterium]
MTNRIEYNGYVIEPTTRLNDDPHGWTLEVRLTPTGSDGDARRCRAPNTYPTKEVAVARCLAFGRRVVDGKAKRKVDPAT